MKLDWTGILTDDKTPDQLAERKALAVQIAWSVYDELGVPDEFRLVVTVPCRALLANNTVLAGAVINEDRNPAYIAIFCDELGIDLEDTIRHELRHQWQFYHLEDLCILDHLLPYRFRVMELDARRFAAGKKPLFSPRKWATPVSAVGTAG